MKRMLITLAFLSSGSAAVAQEHDMAAMSQPSGKIRFHWGAHAVALMTRVSPAAADSAYTESYLTQPTLMGGVTSPNGRFALNTTISLEGATLERGELGPGTYGEGYVDRRHPHTYLHEAYATSLFDLPYGIESSVVAGRGFAPFGTDDPMMRPMIRFPVNHHLSQVLERWMAIGAARRGPVTLELGMFAGNEPLSPRDLRGLRRFGDSWSARVTVRPIDGVELQASRAIVSSPEEPTGNGDGQRKISWSARHERAIGSFDVYGLGEFSRTTITTTRGDAFATTSTLLEGAVARSGVMAAVRLERSDRPEEGRYDNFRTPWPPIEHLFLGITRWSVATAHIQYELDVAGLRFAPYVEASHAHVGSTIRGLFDPEEFYGKRDIGSVSVGFRFDAGMKHTRMGRYGVAQAPMPALDNMDMQH